jgi:hypothetical protein
MRVLIVALALLISADCAPKRGEGSTGLTVKRPPASRAATVTRPVRTPPSDGERPPRTPASAINPDRGVLTRTQGTSGVATDVPDPRAGSDARWIITRTPASQSAQARPQSGAAARPEAAAPGRPRSNGIALWTSIAALIAACGFLYWRRRVASGLRV